MDLYLSHFTNRLDAKGRVSVPASFRAVLARDGFDGLFTHRCLEGPAIDCGGNALLREIDALLSRFSPHAPERDLYGVALLGTSEIVRMDSEGRILLNESLKSYAGIKDEVSFVGLGLKFQLWQPDLFAAHLTEARDRLRLLRQHLGGQGLSE